MTNTTGPRTVQHGGSAPHATVLPPDDRRTERRAGVVAGVALVAMVPLGVFAHFVVLEGMITPGDGAATAAEILAREGTFRLGALSWLTIAVLDVVAAWALYLVFRPVNTAVSMLSAAFRLVYTAVLVVAVGQLLRALDLLSADLSPDALSADQVAAQALLELNAFQHVYDAGVLLFAIHLALLGYLSLRSQVVPGVIGVLLVVAGAGYAFDTAAAVLAIGVPRVAAFTFLGELLLALRLLVAGRRPRSAGSSPAVEVRDAR